MSDYLTDLETQWRAATLDRSRRVWKTQTGREFMAAIPRRDRWRVRRKRLVNRAGIWLCGHGMWRVAARLWRIRL